MNLSCALFNVQRILVRFPSRHNSGSNATPTPEKATNFNVTSDRSDLNEETVALVIFSVIYIVMEQQKKALIY